MASLKQSVIITGGGSGLGKALAKVYSTRFRVYLLGRSEKKLHLAAEEISQTGGDVQTAVCNVTHSDQIKQVFKSIFDQASVYSLINNAGTGIFGPLHELSEADTDAMLNTNVKGVILPTMIALPYFQLQNSGKVMNIISTAGLRGKVNESVYCASKFAVRGFTESLVKEWEGTSIYPTAVYMGGMDTPFWDESDHIADRSRLKSPDFVARQIFEQDDNRPEIFIDR